MDVDSYNTYFSINSFVRTSVRLMLNGFTPHEEGYTCRACIGALPSPPCIYHSLPRSLCFFHIQKSLTMKKWSPYGLKPVAPPHASLGLPSPRQGGASRRQAKPSEAHPAALLKSFTGCSHLIHQRSKGSWLSAQEGRCSDGTSYISRPDLNIVLRLISCEK
jgi:hypothetical protein